MCPRYPAVEIYLSPLGRHYDGKGESGRHYDRGWEDLAGTMTVGSGSHYDRGWEDLAGTMTVGPAGTTGGLVGTMTGGSGRHCDRRVRQAL